MSPRLKNHKISPALEEVILKAISKEPEARYDTAFELGQDLSVRWNTLKAALSKRP